MLAMAGKYLPVSEEEHERNVAMFIAACQQMPSAGADYTHSFADGLYVREMKIRPYTIIVGAKHLKPTLSFLMKGTLALFTKDGLKTLTAPAVIRSGAEYRRIGYSLDDVLFVTVHNTGKTTVEEVEQEWVGMSQANALLNRPDNIQQKQGGLAHEKILSIGQ
jgi:hypothetical protein